MAQAIMDPEKVRRFAEELQRFNSDLENRMIQLQARLGALGIPGRIRSMKNFPTSSSRR